MVSSPRQTVLELPEEINLQLEVANVGSRTLAILADVAICAVALVAVYALTFLTGWGNASDWFSRIGQSAVQIALFLVIFGVQWVYFNLFEWLWNGQTPGKRLLHLRVIKSDGSPVSWSDVLLRNISRPIDTFGPMGLIGLIMIFLSPRAQRVGDLMAGTLVIHETPIDWSIFDQLEAAEVETPGEGAVARIRLDPASWELLHRYLSRREQLPAQVRGDLAQSLYGTLKPFAQGTDLERSALAPDEWLRELARRT